MGVCRFGKVVDGMDVVDEIKLTPTGPNPPFRSDVPIKTIKIESMSVIDKLPSDEPKAAEEPTQQ